jgi:hypothetical protein
MKTVFDVVDLLQLQEVWVRQPIVQAYARLERRRTALPCFVEFDIQDLMPRLERLRRSPAWHTNRLEKHSDPSQMPLCALTDAYLEVLFPDSVSPSQIRRQLFLSVYNHFVVAQYSDDANRTCDLLTTLAEIRAVDPEECLGMDNLPLAGSTFWIPVDLTDEIRALDARYDSGRPDTPAAYVVAEPFWMFMAKVTPADVVAAATRYTAGSARPPIEEIAADLQRLVDVACDWNRISSVVGLCYQVGGAADARG